MAVPVVICRTGNLIHVATYDGTSVGTALPEEVCNLLSSALTYVFRSYDRTYQAKRAGRNKFQTQYRKLYRYDGRERLVCGFGLTSKITSILQKAGHKVHHSYCHIRKTNTNRYELDFESVLDHFEFRPGQQDCLMAIASNECGQISAPPGFGKGSVIQMQCLMFPKATIDVAVPGIDLVKNMVSNLGEVLGIVGQVGAGKRNKERVTVYSADSLQHADGKSDILIADEGHQLAAPKYAPALAQYEDSRNYLFSATVNSRWDGADAELEGLFGPVIYKMTNQEAVQNKLIVPTRVEWLDVIMDHNPCQGLDGARKERAGIWQNAFRNQIIADKAMSYSPDTQVLILVWTLEHALMLRKLLSSEWILCHGSNSLALEEIEECRSMGYLDDSYERMTPKRREALRKGFASGKYKKGIATGNAKGVWSTGVDFVNLEILLRGDATASAVLDTQLPGRVSRINKDGKTTGILIDMLDQFDTDYSRKATTRGKHYAANGWEQVKPKRKG